MHDFHQAQLRTIELLSSFKIQLQHGMNVQQGQDLLLQLNKDMGFLGWLTQPTLLFQSQKNSLNVDSKPLRSLGESPGKTSNIKNMGKTGPKKMC